MTSSLFEVVQPRDDVLQGELTDAIFAANLDEVVDAHAPEVYRDAQRFFETTHPARGLRALLAEALGQLSGARETGSPVIRLETNLGGGKTHSLIALYHAVRGGLDADTAKRLNLVDPDFLPAEALHQIGVFVGTTASPTNFGELHGVQPQTLWGYLALQLGGPDAYRVVEEDDQRLTACGSDAFVEIMGDRPTLILVDEIARYLVAAEGVSVGDSNLAKQTTSFLSALIEAVAASQTRAVLVVTTTEVTDAFGEQTEKVLEAFHDAEALIARQVHVLRPSDEADLPEILRRRLFADVNEDTAVSVAEEYASSASEAFNKGADLPEPMTGPGFPAEARRAYPFHPELVDVLDKRLSTIPNFQRTRGALRLLARAVRRLWEDRPDDTYLVHLHHIDLADPNVVEELSSRLDRPKFEPVIRADIASQSGGDPSHAEQVDEQMGAGYARKIATAAYLYSLTREVPGVAASTLIGSVLAPGDDPNVISKALENLEETAWYLHSDVRGYRFSTEASLARLIHQAENELSVGAIKRKATDILAELFRDSALKVRRTWEDAKVPDRADDAWLVMLHWDEFGDDHGVADPTSEVPQHVQDLWEKKPDGGVREFRNRLVFLVPTRATHESMLRTVRRHVALEQLVSSSDAVRDLADEKREELANMAKESQLQARVAVCNHVNALYVPQGGGLEGIELDVVTQASLQKNQTDAVLDRLAAMEKTLAAGDKPLDPGFIRSKLGAQLETSLRSAELVRVFARRPDFKMVLDRAQITGLISSGVKLGAWEYHDPDRGEAGWGTPERPNVAVRIDENTFIYPPGSAPEIEEAKPKKPELPPLPERELEFREQGSASTAIENVRQKAAEAGRDSVSEVRLAIDEMSDGTAADLAKLTSVIPPGTTDAALHYELTVSCDLDEAGGKISIDFVGQPGDYTPLKQALDHYLRGRQAVVKASVTAKFNTPLSLLGDDFEEIRRRATDTGPARCTIELGVTGEGEGAQ